MFWMRNKKVNFSVRTLNRSSASMYILENLLLQQGKQKTKQFDSLHEGSFISAHVLLNISNKLGKQGLSSILSLFHNLFDTFTNTEKHV